MAYDFNGLEKKIEETEEWLKKEYFTVRTGRATPQVLDNVRVNAYESLMPLNQLATTSVEDARTLRIVPYDISQLKEIEKAITDMNLGLSIRVDEKGIRVSFPELTTENRAQLLKLVKDKLEQARVSLRNERDVVWNDIQKKAKDGEISEDEKFRHKDDIQKLVDGGNEALEALSEKKEKEIAN